ncbi:MAG: two-component regulator propeller domain-containing protein [Bacteroidota bacterium]|jgi:ligand-binding sensor domain-containing protein/two-component sensor histidine kinase|nr:two-component regulator propeller domain-containing protein [Bacteroidota bacterium]HHU96321.1 hypothetical protein [Petrimonas sp.]
MAPLFFLMQFTISAQTSTLPLKLRSEEYVFKEIRLPGDESIRNISDILEDSHGFVWIASRHGLMRYDGHDFKIFYNIPGDTTSIIDTDVLSLYLLGDTTLCIGGKHGVSLMDIRTEKITNLENDQDGNPVESINYFYPDEDGTIWIAALNGLYSFKPDLSGIMNHYLDTPPITKGNPAFAKSVYCIIQHSIDNSLLMLGAECGLISFDKKRNAIHKVYPNREATFWRSQPAVKKFIQEGNFLWCICWISGIPRFDMETETWKNFVYPKTDNRLGTTTNLWSANNIMFKNRDEIWVSDWDRGLYVFNKNTEKLSRLKQEQTYNILNKPYMKIFKLKDGALWLSCDDGLWRQNLRAKQFELLDIPFPHGWVSATLHDDATDEYYFGLHWESYGVACWNSSTLQWTYYQPEIDKKEMFNANDIFKDSNGVIWVATSQRGLWYIDKQNKILKPFSIPDKNFNHFWNNTIYKVFEDSQNNLWLGTGQFGVARLNHNRTKADYFTNDTQNAASLYGTTHFRAIEEDQYGRIWIGSRTGFCMFDPKTETFSHEILLKLQKTGIRDGYTYSILKDTTNVMWLTIEGQGLVKIEEQTKDNFYFNIYQTEDGLKDLTVFYMTSDKHGGLWIVNNGLLYLNPYNNSFMLTDERNGLLGYVGVDAKIMVDRYGNVFSASQVGVGWLDEAEKYSQLSVSNLIIENISINSQPVRDWNPYDETGAPRIVKHNQNNLTFGYTAICFEDYSQVRYRYKLEGLENDWNPPTSILEARYTNLKPGKYRFVVDVSYKGVWLGYNRSVEFSVRQAFWKTWWFLSLSIMIIIVIIYSLYLNRKKHQEKQLQIRTKIASDLHDDVGSTLSSISIMSDLLQSRLDDSPNAEEMLRKIGKNARNMLESMDDIIWSVNPQNDNFHNIIVRIREYAVTLFEPLDIKFTIEAPENIASLQVPMDVRRNLFLIAKEAMNNAAKYSRCTETIIDFDYSHSVLQMTITDNGKGFDTSKDYGRNGLRNMKYRGDKIGGKVTIHSTIGQGTMVAFQAKLG